MYEASNEQELTIRVGEVLKNVAQSGTEGMLVGTQQGRVGLFPERCASLYTSSGPVFSGAVFDSQSMSWKALAFAGNVPSVTGDFSAVAVGGRVFIFGGTVERGEPVNTLSEFDPGTGLGSLV